MIMIMSEIITYWVQTIDGDSINNAPYMPYRCTWSDVTGQDSAVVAGSPNLVVLRVTCDAATLALMEADPDIFVLWSVTDGG